MKRFLIEFVVGVITLGCMVWAYQIGQDSVDCPEPPITFGDTLIHTGGNDGPYCVTAILRMQNYDAFVGQTYADSINARRVYELLSVSGMGSQQLFDHGDWTFRGYQMKAVKWNGGTK